MKIAVIHNLPPGGGLRMITEIIERYKDNNQVDVFVIGEDKPKEINGVKVRFLKVHPWKGFLLRNMWIYFLLPKIHKDIARKINQKYDIFFITHDYFTKSPFILRYLKGNNIYLCQESQREFYEPSTIHAPLLKDKIANIYRTPIKYIDRMNVKYANILLCNSLYSKITIEKIYSKECEVIYPGVDDNFFTPNNIEKDNLILCVGGINRIKDQKFIIQSLRPILTKYKLVLVGSGRREDLEEIYKISKNLKVEVKNNLTDQELRNLYRRALVTCISAHNEPFGLSSIESQACGTPVVAVDEGGPRETIINARTGYLVRRNKSDFLGKVKLAIINSKKMSFEARENATHRWSWRATLRPLDKYISTK